MDLKWIEDFLSLVETRSFSRSAELRHVTQPAFSRRIRTLEDWVGTYLFDRTSYPSALTPAGELFRAEAVEILSRVRRLRSLIYRDPSSHEQTVDLILPSIFSPTLFSPWLTKVEGHLNEFNIGLNVVGGAQADLTRMGGKSLLVMSYDHPDCLADIDLSCYERVVVGQQLIRPYVRAVRGRKPLFELPGRRNAPLPFLAYAPGGYMHRVTSLILRQGKAPVHLTERYQADAIERLKSMVMAGRGIAFLPDSAVSDEFEKRYLTIAGDERWQLKLDVCLYRRTDVSDCDVDRIWARFQPQGQSTPGRNVRRLRVVNGRVSVAAD